MSDARKLNTKKSIWMLYGANGYTGKLIAEEACRRGIKPVLAGRNEKAVSAIAKSLGLTYRCFSLDDSAAAVAALADITAVLHCAGPFSATAKPMLKACIATGTHYLDITGEIEIFEFAKSLDQQARDAKCVLMPGVGFDVVATDCLAAKLATQVKEPLTLEMAFCGEGGASPGTAKTFVEMLPEGGFIRQDHHITRVPSGYKRKAICFSDRSAWCMSIPWGDISTAYSTTGIPNIVVYTAVPRVAALLSRLMSPLMVLMKPAFIQQKLKRLIEKNVQGPDEATRQGGCMRLWGRVENAKGEHAEQWLDLADGYQFTILASLAVMEALSKTPLAPGYQTPAGAFGADFIESIPGSRWHIKNV